MLRKVLEMICRVGRWLSHKSAGSSGPWTPATVGASLVGWYKADALALSNGASVSTWADSSGNSGPTLSASGTTPTFASSAIGGKPGVVFGGSGLLGIASVNLLGAAANDFTFVCVTTEGASQAVNANMWGIDYGSGCGPSYENAAGTNWDATWQVAGTYYGAAGGRGNPLASGNHTFTVRKLGTTQNDYTDGVQKDSQTVGASMANVAASFSIGGRGSRYYTGTICELIVVNRGLSDAELSKLATYINGKYGI